MKAPRRRKHGRSFGAAPKSLARRRWRAIAGIAIGLLAVIGWLARESIPRRVKDETVSPLNPAASSFKPQSPPGTAYTDADVSAAANRLFAAVNPLLPENSYFPPFAKAKISWVLEQRQAGKLSFILLKNVADAGLSFEAIMASAKPEGKPVIIIARPRFIEFLSDGGLGSLPFSRQQRNDFALSLVHEVIHLESPGLSSATTPHDHLVEEQRAWREVDVSVVRELRRLHEPMNVRFVNADDAIKSCHDTLPCEPLKALLLPTEANRF